MEKMTIEELMKEYIKVRNRLDVAEGIITDGVGFRAEANAKIKALETVEGALKCVVDTQRARIGDLTKENEKHSNLVASRLRKLPDFMIVSITERGNLEVCGECPTPRDLHRHSGYYFDHPSMSKVALYAKIEFPFEDDDTMAVMRPVMLNERREGDTMAEEKPEETREEKPELTSEKPGFDISKSRGSGETPEETSEEPITDEVGDQERVTIEIGEMDPEIDLPEGWEEDLDKYTEMMKLCYDRALSVNIIPEMAGRMALALYDTLTGAKDAAYKEFLGDMKVYMERLAPEPTPPIEPLSFLGTHFGFVPTDFQKPTEPREHPGVEYDKYMVVTEYANGDYHVSHYHEGLGGAPGGLTGKGQAKEAYSRCRDHPTVRRAYLVMNISDEVPSDEPDQEEPDQVDDKEPPAKEPDGENT